MMTDKERVRELLKKVWLEGYTEDNEGVSQCKQDMEYIEDYIAYLEGIERMYERDIELFAAILNKANVEFMNLSMEEIENNDVFYSIFRYDDEKRVTVSKHNPYKYFEGEELKNDKTN